MSPAGASPGFTQRNQTDSTEEQGEFHSRLCAIV